MMQTREKIRGIMQEIETPERKSGKQIGEQILGRKVADDLRAVSGCCLEIQQLQEYVERNNASYVISTGQEAGGSVGFIKRMFHKIRGRLVGSMADQETAFNASVTCSINHLYNNMIILQHYADEQAGIIRRLEDELAQQRFLNAVSEEKIRELYQKMDEKGGTV